MDDMVDEIDRAFRNTFPETDGYPVPWTWLTIDWTPYPVYGNVVNIIVQVTSRFIVGVPLCISILDEANRRSQQGLSRGRCRSC